VYIDNDIYVDIFTIDDFEQCVAASIEAIYILLGPSDLQRRQDPFSFDKLTDMTIGPVNRVLGNIVDTRRMTLSTPLEFIAEVQTSLTTTWGPHRKSFTLREIETLVGKLNHMALAAPWLKFLMAQVYTSTASSLRCSEAHLIATSASFQADLKALKHPPVPSAPAAHTSFFLREHARQVHHNPQCYHINCTLRAKLSLIRDALALPPTSHSCPLAHLVPRTPTACVRGDASLSAAGGYSADLGFWWHIEWPPDIRARTLRH